MQPVLLNGQWTGSDSVGRFQAVNPATGEAFGEAFPISSRAEVEQAVAAAAAAFDEVKAWNGDRFADFLNHYAEAIESRGEALANLAHEETGLPVEPRLLKVELPRTTNQLRQAAKAAATGSWAMPTIDTQAGIRSMFGPLGPVVIFGPNNFPLAFNSISGGDAAAAFAAGNPVIAKGHPSHPGTTRLLAEAAFEATQTAGMPSGFVQLIYHCEPESGLRMVSHPAIGACGYTGSRKSGLALKQAADNAGKPIYLEMSSVNPVFILPGALAERGEKLAEEFAGSCLMAAGQFCTNPGLVVLCESNETEAFISDVRQRFADAAEGTMLASGVRDGFAAAVESVQAAGAELLLGGKAADDGRFHCQNTLLKVNGRQFLEQPEVFQTEMFGNGALFVVAADADEAVKIAGSIEGNLTGCVYSHTGDDDDELCRRVSTELRFRVGRLLNDKMPTGVAVSPAMNHGGPYPASGHPGFTAVGIPAAVRRFGMLQCYDNVRDGRLPALLQNGNPSNATRLVDGTWTDAPIS